MKLRNHFHTGNSSTHGSPIILYILLFAVSVSPLFLGSNRPLPWSMLSFASGLLLLSWSIQVSSGKFSFSPQFEYIRFPFWLFISVGAWIFFQNSPFTPLSWQNSAWQDASFALGNTVTGSISVNPYESYMGLMKLFTYGTIFFLSFQYSTNTKNAKLILKIVLFSGLAYSAFGLYIYLSGTSTVPWHGNDHHSEGLRSTFANRNHFATYSGMIALVALAQFMDITFKVSGQYSYLGEEIVRTLYSILESGWIYIILFIVSFSSLLLTFSRGGLISTTGAIAILFLLYLFSSKNRKLSIALSFITLCICYFGIMSISGETTSNRMRNSDLEDSRMIVYASTIKGISESPFFGKGYGTYAESFPKYRDRETGMFFTKAHNVYLETAFELGIPATALLLSAFGALIFTCLRGIMMREHNFMFPVIGLASTALVAIHSLFDFSIQIPANASLYALIMGMSASQSLKRKRSL
ncbi:MAG: O-antigen ligase family protein [Nitrospinota bacterium]|nr:O-antigen ligase family protein [Nitrospinota bacterium]